MPQIQNVRVTALQGGKDRDSILVESQTALVISRKREDEDHLFNKAGWVPPKKE